jgi:hypothetical protein
LTGDNWFTSVPLVRKLLELNTTYVGTIRKNKREIPPEFQANSSKEPNSSMFEFQKDMTLVSYIPKKKRSVILISSMHDNDAIDETTASLMKPEIITFYNQNKFGVDVVDQMCESYNVARTSRKWPLVHFFNMINVSGINAFVICKKNTKEPKMERVTFLKRLSLELMKPYLVERAKSSTTSYSVRLSTAKFAGVTIEPPPKPDSEATRTRSEAKDAIKASKRPESAPCALCSLNKKKSITRMICQCCDNFTCKDHIAKICTNCSK